MILAVVKSKEPIKKKQTNFTQDIMGPASVHVQNHLCPNINIETYQNSKT